MEETRHEDEALLEAATLAARKAAEVHRSAVGGGSSAAWAEKGTSDFVTEVDLEAERRIVETLRGRYPDHRFLAEEGTVAFEPRSEEDPAGRGESVHWIIDPLDGTTNWLHGYPEYAVSIAALDRQGLRVAVVLNSATGETFDAVRGSGSRRNGEPIRTSSVGDIRFALLATGFPFKKTEFLPRYLAMLDRALRHTAGVRRAGAAALDLCALACGRVDAFWETWLMPWDVAAGALIVREAGGRFEALGPDLVEAEAREQPVAGADEAASGELVEDASSRADAVLGAAIRSGRAFVDLCGGRRSAGSSAERLGEGGAYMAANAHLLDSLRKVLF